MTAYSVVKIIAVPMILFTAFGVMLCSLVIRKISACMGSPVFITPSLSAS